VFIDVLSLERRDPGDPAWLPYAQFVRTFLLPLLANRHFGMALDQLLFTRRDGLEPEEVYRWLRPLQRVWPPFLSLVSMPVWLGSRHNLDDASIYRKKVLPDAARARFIVRTLLNGLKRRLRALAPKSGVSSAWTGYMEFSNNYTAEHFAAKERFVAECLSAYAPKRVLDAGCNTGHFSFMAARSGAQVVAIDYDPAVVGTVWRKATAEKLDVLPLVVNLTRPTPGVGWNNREWPSFLDRARGSFDAVFMLAVIHHMLVTERVPLNDIMSLAAELTSDLLVIEFVSPQDSMFRRLVRGREELHQDLNESVFERCCQREFDIVSSQHFDGTSRWLYLMRLRKDRRPR
jgi:predicted RNA methylase